MVIHIVSKYGECYHPKVIIGLAKVGCHVMNISSESKDCKHGLDRRNIYENWKNAMKYFDGDVFIGMDSDVVLREGNVEKLIKKLKDASFAYYPTDIKNTHGLWVVKKKVIEKVPFKFSGEICPICSWKVDLIAAGFINWRMGEMLETVQRLTKE